jgi:hypothetical protein
VDLGTKPIIGWSLKPTITNYYQKYIYPSLVVITNGWKEIPRFKEESSRLTSKTKGAKQNVKYKRKPKRRIFSLHQELR